MTTSLRSLTLAKLTRRLPLFSQVVMAVSLVSLTYLAGAQQINASGGRAAGGAIAIIFITLSFASSRACAATDHAIATRLETLAGGDVATPIPFTQYGGGVGRIARAAQSLLEATTAKLEAATQAGARGHLVERERAISDVKKAEDRQQDYLTIDALGQGLAKLARGELTGSIETPFAPKAEQLRLDYNTSIEKFKRMVLAIVSSADAIGDEAQEISSVSSDLSRRTDQQAASLGQTTAALEEITATVRRAAEGAKRASEVVAVADTDAKKSAQVVQQTVEAMDAIAQSALEISKIIGVIDEIAFQTNLLALNAGVEAARAGDAGRGFAVVASEVRALAQRSAAAAKQIKGLISASTQQVNRGVELVAQTGASLEKIMTQVGEITVAVSEIATGVRRQSTGLEATNAAVSLMDQATRQNAAMVEKTAVASHALSWRTSQLSELAARFQVGGARRDLAPQQRQTTPQPSASASKPGRHDANRLETRRPPPPPSAPRRAAKAATANRASVGAGAGDWEEF
jgi:methyl-accepting chemotaxis protein